MPEFNGISHVELTVSDAGRSSEWYERVLGLRKIADTPSDEHPTPGVVARVVNLLHPSSLLILGLIEHSAGEPAPFSELRVGLDHLSLAVASREDLDLWADHLDRCGVRRSPIRDDWYGSALAFRDPDNIQLELFVIALG